MQTSIFTLNCDMIMTYLKNNALSIFDIPCQKTGYLMIPKPRDTINIVAFQMEHYLETPAIVLTLYLI